MLYHWGSDGIVTPMPFTYASGEMMSIVEEVADYIAGMELVDSLWEAVAADRLKTILENRVRIGVLGKLIEDLKVELAESREIADMWTIKEVAR